MKKLFLVIIIVLGAFLISFRLQAVGQKTVLAQESPEQKLQKLNSEIERYQREIDKLKAQANTLANQIAQYDAQIKLTTLKITQVEEKILLLGGFPNRSDQCIYQ